MRYVIDIETAGLPDVADFMEPVTAPANYRDQDKIAAYIAEKQTEQVSRAGLDLDLCSIVAIGLQPEGERAIHTWLAPFSTEAAILTDFWARLLTDKNPILIGFNSLGFDLPVLIRRSQYLDIPYPRFTLDRYRTPHIDLMQLLTWNGLVRARGLKFYARRFGIPYDDGVCGADIAALVAAGDWDQVKAHCESDVRLTTALAQRLGVLKMETQTEMVF